MPWFWQGRDQGGGVLSDMTCHSVEVGRYLLTKPGAPRTDLKLVSASATVGNLKWTRPEYVARLKNMMGAEIDYATRPAEDFARGALIFRDAEGHEVMVEATNSWAYVGAGLRILIELLGPEYSMEFSSLNTGLKVFLSRNVTGGQGEDLVEKQNAEQGLMPVVENEADIYGYIGEDRHMVEAFAAADRDFPRRRRCDRDADGVVSLGRDRPSHKLPRSGPGKLRAAGGKALSQKVLSAPAATPHCRQFGTTEVGSEAAAHSTLGLEPGAEFGLREELRQPRHDAPATVTCRRCAARPAGCATN